MASLHRSSGNDTTRLPKQLSLPSSSQSDDFGFFAGITRSQDFVKIIKQRTVETNKMSMLWLFSFRRGSSTNFMPIAVLVMVCCVASVLLQNHATNAFKVVVRPSKSLSVTGLPRKLISQLSSSPSSLSLQNDDGSDIPRDDHPMAKTSRFSHVMFKVPSVDQAVEYWVQKGGKVLMSREDPEATNGQARLLSAFVELGGPKNVKNGTEEKEESTTGKTKSFALELVAIDKEKFELGNIISYIGVSLLLQFQNNLLGVITGDKPESQGPEPSGIPVQSCASAPGDYLCRLALKSNKLSETLEFYTSVLGMDAKAQDDRMICLRYDNNSDGEIGSGASGVPTTLVFDTTTEDDKEEELVKGNCLDHLAIGTSAGIEEQYERIKNLGTCSIFMKPTEMFGQTVMGVIDPNGYKVVLASGG